MENDVNFYVGRHVLINEDHSNFPFSGTIIQWDQYGFIVKGYYRMFEDGPEHEIYFPHSNPLIMHIL